MELNNEQRKHLAITLRTTGIGALIPIGLKIYGAAIPIWTVVVWVAIAISFEFLAIRILKEVTND